MSPTTFKTNGQGGDSLSTAATMADSDNQKNQDRPFTRIDAWRAIQTFRSEFAGGAAVLAVVLWLVGRAISGGWINTPVTDIAVKTIVEQQNTVNEKLLDQIASMNTTLSAHSNEFVQLHKSILALSEGQAKIQGYLSHDALTQAAKKVTTRIGDVPALEETMGRSQVYQSAPAPSAPPPAANSLQKPAKRKAQKAPAKSTLCINTGIGC